MGVVDHQTSLRYVISLLSLHSTVYERVNRWCLDLGGSHFVIKICLYLRGGEVRFLYTVGLLEIGSVIQDRSGIYLFPLVVFCGIQPNKYENDYNKNDHDYARQPATIFSVNISVLCVFVCLNIAQTIIQHFDPSRPESKYMQIVWATWPYLSTNEVTRTHA